MDTEEAQTHVRFAEFVGVRPKRLWTNRLHFWNPTVWKTTKSNRKYTTKRSGIFSHIYVIECGLEIDPTGTDW